MPQAHTVDMRPLRLAPNDVLNQIVNTLYTEIQTKNDTPDAPLDDVSPSAIAAAITQMADSIRVTLLDRFIKSREARNTQSAIYALPVEILSGIFITSTSVPTGGQAGLMVDTLAHYKQLFAISAVCSRWNTIIKSTPTLWTLIDSQLPSSLVDEALFLSKQLPLTISCEPLDMRKNALCQNALLKRFLIQTRHSISRWRVVKLVMFDIRDVEVILNKAAPLLEEILINGVNVKSYGKGIRWFSRRTPNVKAVTFDSVYYLDWGLIKQCPCLTSITMSVTGFTIEEARAFGPVLAQLKSIEVLRMSYIYILGEGGLFRFEMPTVHLPHLKTVELESVEHNISFGLLKMLETPNLEAFLLEENDDVERRGFHPDVEDHVALEESPLSAWKIPPIAVPYDLLMEWKDDRVVYHISSDAPKSEMKYPSKRMFSLVLGYDQPWDLASTVVWFGRSVEVGSIPAPRSATLSFAEGYYPSDVPIFVRACRRIPHIHYMVLDEMDGYFMDFLLNKPQVDGTLPFPELRSIKFEDTSFTNEEDLKYVRKILQTRNGTRGTSILGVSRLEDILLPKVEDDDSRALFNAIDKKYGPGVLRERPVNTHRRNRKAMAKLLGTAGTKSEDREMNDMPL